MDVVNSALVALALIFIFAVLVWLVEGRTNSELADLRKALYWSIQTTATVGYGDAVTRTHAGRALSSVWILISLLVIAVLTALVSAQLTQALLAAAVSVQSLEDVSGTLCMESAYPQLASFVREDVASPPSVVADLGQNCMAAVADGSMQAFIGDSTFVAWYASTYAVPGLTVSAIIPGSASGFSLVLNASARGNALKAWLDPAVAQLVSGASTGYNSMVQNYLVVKGIALPATPPTPTVWWAVVVIVVVSAIAIADALNVDLRSRATSLRWRNNAPDKEPPRATLPETQMAAC
jgi:hypothetical protein